MVDKNLPLAEIWSLEKTKDRLNCFNILFGVLHYSKLACRRNLVYDLFKLIWTLDIINDQIKFFNFESKIFRYCCLHLCYASKHWGINDFHYYLLMIMSLQIFSLELPHFEKIQLDASFASCPTPGVLLSCLISIFTIYKNKIFS